MTLYFMYMHILSSFKNKNLVHFELNLFILNLEHLHLWGVSVYVCVCV